MNNRNDRQDDHLHRVNQLDLQQPRQDHQKILPRPQMVLPRPQQPPQQQQPLPWLPPILDDYSFQPKLTVDLHDGENAGKYDDDGEEEEEDGCCCDGGFD